MFDKKKGTQETRRATPPSDDPSINQAIRDGKKAFRGIKSNPYPGLFKFLRERLHLDLALGFGPLTDDWTFPAGGFVIGKTQVTEADIISMKEIVGELKNKKKSDK